MGKNSKDLGYKPSEAGPGKEQYKHKGDTNASSDNHHSQSKPRQGEGKAQTDKVNAHDHAWDQELSEGGDCGY